MLRGGGVVSLVGAGGKTSLMFRIAGELAEKGDAVLTTTTTKILRPGTGQSPHVLLSDSVAGIIDGARPLLEKHRHLTAASGESSPGKLVGFPPDIIDSLIRTRMFKWIIVEADGASRMPLKAPAEHEPVIPFSTGWLIGVVGLDAVGKPLACPYVFRPDLFSEVTGVPLGGVVSESSVTAVLADEKGIMKGVPPRARKLVFLNKADDGKRIGAGRKIADQLGLVATNRPTRVVIGTATGKMPVVMVVDTN